MSIDEFHHSLYELFIGYIEECETEYIRPIVTRQYDTSWDTYDRHTYNGGALRIHMLNSLLGDSFWPGVQEYQKTYNNRVVEESDFRKCLESSSKVNLSRFYDQWIYGCGYPVISTEIDISATNLWIEMKQVQSTKYEQKFVPKSFDLEIEATIAIKQEKSFREEHCMFKFSNGENTAIVELEFNFGEQVYAILLDPQCKVVLFDLEDYNPGQDIFINTLKYSKSDVINRIRAAKGLVDIGTKYAIETLTKILMEEKFYGVKAYAVSHMGENKTTHTSKAICTLLDAETDPMVMIQYTEACIDFRDANIKRSLFEFLSRQEELPYMAKANALEAFGSQIHSNEQEAVDFITKHIDQDNRYLYALVRKGGYLGLGYLGETAAEILLERYHEERVECRESILFALAQVRVSCHECVDRIDNTIRHACSDEAQMIREAAFNAIAHITNTETSIEQKHINNFSNMVVYDNFAQQNHPYVERTQMRIHHRARNEQAWLREIKQETVVMQEKIRNLEARIDKN